MIINSQLAVIGGAVDFTNFFEVDLPTELQVGTLYSFVRKSGKVILSSDQTDIGIYLFNPTTKAFAHPVTTGSYFNTFQEVEDNCLISSSSSVGIYLHNSLDDSIGALSFTGSTTYTYQYLTLMQDRVICRGSSSTSGIVIYYNSTLSATLKYAINGNYSRCIFGDTDNAFICSISSSNYGLQHYNYTTDAINHYLSSYSYFYITKLADGRFGVGQNVSTGGDGFNVLDITTNTIMNIIATGSLYKNLSTQGNITLLCSYSNGLYYFDCSTNILTQTTLTTGIYFNSLVIGLKVLCSGTSSLGLYVFDFTDFSVTQLIATEYNWLASNCYFALPSGKYLIASSTRSPGLYLYNPTDNAFTQLIATVGGFTIWEETTDKVIAGNTAYVTGSNLYNIITYDKTLETASVTYTNFSDVNINEVDGDLYVSSDTSTLLGIKKFTDSTNTWSVPLAKMYGFTQLYGTDLISTTSASGAFDTTTLQTKKGIGGYLFGDYVIDTNLVQKLTDRVIKELYGRYTVFSTNGNYVASLETYRLLWGNKGA